MDWYSSKRATTVIPDGEGWNACIYHQTKVVRWNRSQVTLNSGGFQSATTKKRMNEVSEHYGLGFQVFQKGGDWFVTVRGGKTLPFEDGMTFDH